MRRALWGCIALCLLAGLVLVPTTGDDDADDARLSSGATATTAVVDAGEGSEASTEPLAEGGDDAADTTAPASDGPAATNPGGIPPGAPTTSAAPGASAGGGAPATTVAPLPPPEDLGAAEDPGPVVPPRAGTYRYKARSGGEERESRTVVEDRGSNALGTSQVISQRGGGLDISSDVSWRSDSVVVLKSVFTFGQTKGECDWEPDFVQSKLPLAKGVAWQSTSTCMVSGFGPTPMTVKRSLDARVVDLRRVRIAGRPVDVWAIDSTDTLEIAGRVIEQKGTSLFSPKHGLVVSTSGTATISGPDGRQSRDYSTELQNLDPE